MCGYKLQEGHYRILSRGTRRSNAQPDWFHAMDRASYSEYGRGEKAEACRRMDPACRNSYPLGVLGCYDRDVTLCKSNRGHCCRIHSDKRKWWVSLK
jgi:hypothetical protein